MSASQDVNQGVDPAAAAQQLVGALTLAYHRLTSASDTLHAEAGVTTGARSVLLTLNDRGPATIADLARARSVSRQFMQRLVSGLVAKGWLEERPNPRHRRSPMLVPTPTGAALIARIREAEAPRWTALGARFAPADLDAACRVLDGLASALDG